MVSCKVWERLDSVQLSVGRDLIVLGKVWGEASWCQIKFGERVYGVRQSVGRDLMASGNVWGKT